MRLACTVFACSEQVPARSYLYELALQAIEFFISSACKIIDHKGQKTCMAEEARFELAIELPLYCFSRAAPSTTRPLLHTGVILTKLPWVTQRATFLNFR